MGSEKTTLLTERVSAGKRNYWFNVNSTANGAIYLSICESKWNGTNYTRQRIIVFQQDLPAFSETLTKVLEFISGNPSEE